MVSILINEILGALLQLLFFLVIPFVWWVCKDRKKDNFLSWIGICKVKPEKSIFVSLIVTILATLLYGIAMNKIIELMPNGITEAGSSFSGMGAQALPAAVIYAFFRTALSEEIFFRGFLLKRVAKRFGFITGNTVQALLFGLLHGVPFALATGSIMTLLLCTLLPGLFGWFEGWLNEKRFGESIMPSWILHGIINTIAACSGL